MVNSLSYSRSSQCSTTGVTEAVYVISCMWDGAYKRTLAANRKEQPMWRQRVSSLAIGVVLYHMPDAI